MKGWWIIPFIVLGVAIWSAIFGWINGRAAILIMVAFVTGLCWAAWWLIYVNGR